MPIAPNYLQALQQVQARRRQRGGLADLLGRGSQVAQQRSIMQSPAAMPAQDEAFRQLLSSSMEMPKVNMQAAQGGAQLFKDMVNQGSMAPLGASLMGGAGGGGGGGGLMKGLGGIMKIMALFGA